MSRSLEPYRGNAVVALRRLRGSVALGTTTLGALTLGAVAAGRLIRRLRRQPHRREAVAPQAQIYGVSVLMVETWVSRIDGR